MTSLQRRVARLEKLYPPPPPPTEEELQRPKRWKKIATRLEKIFLQAHPLLSDEQQEQILQAYRQIGGETACAFTGWVDDLLDGLCRLPELSPEAGKELLLAWVSPEVDGGSVCKQCGLEYPQHRCPPISEWKLLPGKTPRVGPPPWYDLPEFFQTCPSCGASRYDIDWPHLVRDKYYPWMELDGYMGVARKTRQLPA